MKMSRLAVGLALAVLAGCGDLEDDRAESSDASTGTAHADSSEASARTGLAESPEADGRDQRGQRDAAEDSPLVLGRGGVPIVAVETRTYLLQLVNLTGEPAVVYADAGAGRVVLDTLDARDSARVNIEIRAREVRLEASDLTGRTLREARISPRADSLTRWEIRG